MVVIWIIYFLDKALKKVSITSEDLPPPETPDTVIKCSSETLY